MRAVSASIGLVPTKAPASTAASVSLKAPRGTLVAVGNLVSQSAGSVRPTSSVMSGTSSRRPASSLKRARVWSPPRCMSSITTSRGFSDDFWCKRRRKAQSCSCLMAAGSTDSREASISPAADRRRAVTSSSSIVPSWRMTSAATRGPPMDPYAGYAVCTTMASFWTRWTSSERSLVFPAPASPQRSTTWARRSRQTRRHCDSKKASSSARPMSGGSALRASLSEEPSTFAAKVSGLPYLDGFALALQ